MEFKLLFHLDMVPDICLILLQLLLIFLGRQVDTLEGARKTSFVEDVSLPVPSISCAQVSKSQLLETKRQPRSSVVVAATFSRSAGILIAVVFQLHQNLNARFDVLEDREGIETEETLSFPFELVLSKSIDLIPGPDFYLKV